MSTQEFNDTVQALADLKPGDMAFVLNGRQNSIFDAQVLEVTMDVITVWNQPKMDRQRFSRITGEAIAPEGMEMNPNALPTLVVPDDWRVKVLNSRRRFAQMHDIARHKMSEFADHPNENTSLALIQYVQSFVSLGLSMDPLALQAASIQEYINLRNRAESPEEGQS